MQLTDLLFDGVQFLPEATVLLGEKPVIRVLLVRESLVGVHALIDLFLDLHQGDPLLEECFLGVQVGHFFCELGVDFPQIEDFLFQNIEFLVMFFEFGGLEVGLVFFI